MSICVQTLPFQISDIYNDYKKNNLSTYSKTWVIQGWVRDFRA